MHYSRKAAANRVPRHPLRFTGLGKFESAKVVEKWKLSQARWGGGVATMISAFAQPVNKGAGWAHLYFWITMVNLASADCVFSSLIVDSNQLGYCL